MAVVTESKKALGAEAFAISAVTVAELNHGVYRAHTGDLKLRRRQLVDEVIDSLTVVPLTVQIALRTGQIEGEQAALGNVIGFEDPVIGATALEFGFDVLTFNLRHFTRIPSLRVRTP